MENVRMSRNSSRQKAPTIPSLEDDAIEKVFDSVPHMAKKLDAFASLLYRYYSTKDKELAGDIPNMFGFILRHIDVVDDPNIKMSRVSVPPGQGRVVVYASRRKEETDEQWEERQHEIKSLYMIRLPRAQIQAQVQLYLLLKDQAQENIEHAAKIKIEDLDTSALNAARKTKSKKE